jgi:uncharacterized protein YcnI
MRLRQHPRSRRSLPRALVVVAVVAATLLTTTSRAAAHIAVDRADPNSDGTTNVTLTWNHGCSENAATTGVEISAGEGIEFIGATTSLAWEPAVSSQRVTFEGSPVPPEKAASVVVTVRMTAAAGSTVYLPTDQQCTGEHVAWIDAGDNDDHPAPRLIVTTAMVPAADAPESSTPSSGADLSQAIVGVLTLAAALALVGALWYRKQPQPSSESRSTDSNPNQ